MLGVALFHGVSMEYFGVHNYGYVELSPLAQAKAKAKEAQAQSINLSLER